LSDVIQFAMGLKADTAGKYLHNYTSPLKPLAENVGLIGISNGGNAAISVAGLHGNKLSTLGWILNWESPVGDGMPTIEAGAINHGYNPLVNPAYNDITGIFDYTKLRWNDTVAVGIALHGGFYFEANANTTLDLGVDFVVQPLVYPTIWGLKGFYSVSLMRAAYERAVYPLRPPAHLPDSTQNRTFWETRNGVNWIDSSVVRIPNLFFLVIASKQDHAQAAPDYPHILIQYEGFREAGARLVR